VSTLPLPGPPCCRLAVDRSSAPVICPASVAYVTGLAGAALVEGGRVARFFVALIKRIVALSSVSCIAGDPFRENGGLHCAGASGTDVCGVGVLCGVCRSRMLRYPCKARRDVVMIWLVYVCVAF
jgi:hypothetical protein